MSDKQKKFTIIDSYKTYNGDIDKDLYKKLLFEFFWEVSYTIIRSKYKYKMPKNLGTILTKQTKYSKNKVNTLKKKLEGSKNENLMQSLLLTDFKFSCFAWNKNLNYSGNSILNYYKFKPIRGEDRKIGKNGLKEWIQKCAKDPKLKDYHEN